METQGPPPATGKLPIDLTRALDKLMMSGLDSLEVELLRRRLAQFYLDSPAAPPSGSMPIPACQLGLAGPADR